ncbi:unnamed protein product [Effrenium voratum]|nr:unnamed protein product [Effrenium voratum]
MDRLYTPSPSELRTPSRSVTPSQVLEQPIFPPLPMDRAGCPSGIQFRPERRPEEFRHPYLQHSFLSAQTSTGYSGFLPRSSDVLGLNRSHGKGNWEAARLGMPSTLHMSRSVPTLFATAGRQTLKL